MIFNFFGIFYFNFMRVICAYIKCVEEVRMGNAEFIKAKKTIFDEIVAFDSDEVKFFMENFMGAYQLSLDELD